MYAVAISPDGSTIAAGGWTENIPASPTAIYLFDREFGAMTRRIHATGPTSLSSLSRPTAAIWRQRFSDGLQVFDRDKQWNEVFRDDHTYDGT